MGEVKLLSGFLEDAVSKVYLEKRFVLQYNKQYLEGLEQAFAFRVGLYLHEILKNTKYQSFDLDAEYNKSLGASKMLEEFPNGIRPDLILHERGTHKYNKLAIEFKGNWNPVMEKDQRKLVGLTSSAGDYNYKLGALIILKPDMAEYIYYIDGKIVTNE